MPPAFAGGAGTSAGADVSNPAGGAAEATKQAKPKTMADLLRDSPDPNGPQVFVPDKIQNIGFASTSNGIPAIYFSGAEIQKLADNIGHAIVGKFSHSIPTSQQIQRSLDNIKFGRSYSWKYINAKHILVQFEDLADYARLLGGPKGTPVWYVDRHPMRVFKWSPDFDAYCESPIAAIWCNLIGLPIHLFDQSALFAIGKLLGTPIQVDRATADKSRLSFARLCIEIDITKPPPEEIILDICGRETVQQVRWGKIPSYCRECKHVGHTSEVCYASGKMERPEKRNYNKAAPKQKQNEDQGAKGKQEQPAQHPKGNERGYQGKNHTQGRNGSGPTTDSKEGPGVPSNSGPKGKKDKDSEWLGPDIMGDSPVAFGTELQDPGGQSGSKGDVYPGHNTSLELVTIPRESESFDYLRGQNRARRGPPPRGRGGSRGSGRYSGVGGRGNSDLGNYMSTNKYYSLMANGEFDVDGCGENEDFEMDAQPPPEAIACIPLRIEGGIDCRSSELQGGESSSPGTTPPC